MTDDPSFASDVMTALAPTLVAVGVIALVLAYEVVGVLVLALAAPEAMGVASTWLASR